MNVDERRAVIRDIFDRVEKPRFYAGDWAGDQADRLLRAIGEPDGRAWVAERALADDLAAVLAKFADDWLGEGCEGPVAAVLTRYREARDG